MGAAANKGPSIAMNEMLDDLARAGVERTLERLPVLHLIIREDQPIGISRSARADQVSLDLDGCEVGDPDRHHGEDTDGDGKLSENSRLDRRPLGNRIGLPHEPGGKANDLRPHRAGQNLPDDGEILIGEAARLIVVQPEMNLIDDPDLLSDHHKHAAKIDRRATRRLAVTAPIVLDDTFDEVRRKQCRSESMLGRGTPTATALRAVAMIRLRRYTRVEGLHGRRLFPFGDRRSCVRPWR